MPTGSTTARRRYDAYGASAEVFLCRDPRVLVEGPANTGKSRGLCELANHMAIAYPGIRVLFCRQTLQSLRESVLVTLEDKVWTPDHPAKSGTASRATRRVYQYPAEEGQNPSTIVLGGLEDPGWTYSMEYDVIFIFEAWQVSKDSLERLYRANRNHILCRYSPDNAKLAKLVEKDWTDDRWLKGHKCWQQIFCDTNPAGEFHHLNQMAAPVDSGTLEEIRGDSTPSTRVFHYSEEYPFTRILSRHEDNPACTEDDLAKLRALTGHRKSRLYYGLWTSAEGLVWPEFDATVHCITAELVREGLRPSGKTDKRPISLDIRKEDGTTERRAIKWTFGSQDYGYTNPGCFQVWGVDYERRLYMLAEIYRKGMRDDWWADEIVKLWEEFDLFAIVADSEDPGRIELMNERLHREGGRAIVHGVKKSVPKGSSFSRFKPAALDLVATLFERRGMFILRDSLRCGRDPELREQRQPTSTAQEIGSFTFLEHDDGKPDKETPDPSCADHGCDASQYAAVFYHWMDHDRNPKKTEVGTAGWRFGH